ncbi:MAG TPA: clan AA aspartic protease [Verrucomicrobiota bacterium]|nr:clan AA aspartic protease [Verrucomicrobiota bacterium]
MGLVHAEIQLANGEDIVLARRGLLEPQQIRRLSVMANVDSGTYMLCLNERVREQLGLATVDRRIAALADGSQHTLDVVGPVEVRFENRRCSVDALVLPADNEVLLGAIPMEDMDLVILPRERRLAVNPEHPILPVVPVK